METPDLKHCPICNLDLPLSRFGECKARKDRMNLYCKSCINKKVAAGRLQRKQMILARKQVIKPLPPPLQTEIVGTPINRVREAIRQGYRTRDQIKSATRLPWDELTDSLAILNIDQGVIRLERINGEAYFFERKIA